MAGSSERAASRSAGRPARALAGATVLQAIGALGDDQIGRAALDLAVAQLRSGARALVAGGGGALVGELQALGGEWIALDLAATRPFRRRRTAQALESLMRSEQVALVHAQGMEPARYALQAAKSAGIALVTSYLGMPPEAGWGARREDAQARGDLVLSCSEFAAERIAERHRIARERIVVVPRGVDTDWFDPAAVSAVRVQAVRESWRIRPEVRVILAPGRLTPPHGHLMLVDAMRMLANGGLRGIVLVIAGKQPADEAYVANLDARIAAQGLGGIIRRTGECGDMAAAYAAADLVLLQTDHAGPFSAMVAEAQAMARPVIAPNLGAIPELLLAPEGSATESRSGWLVQPGDMFDLARTLASALALGPAALAGIGANGRAFAKAAFAPMQVAGATLAVYDWLLRGEG